MNSQEKILDISWGTILKLAVAGLTIYVLFLVRDILVWVLFGLIISILFDPAIDFLQRRKIPRPLGVIGVYSVTFGILALIIWSIAPFFVNEIQRFSQLFPQYFDTLSPALRGLGISAFTDAQSFFDAMSLGVEKIAGNIFSALFVVFGGIFSFLSRKPYVHATMPYKLDHKSYTTSLSYGLFFQIIPDSIHKYNKLSF